MGRLHRATERDLLGGRVGLCPVLRHSRGALCAAAAKLRLGKGRRGLPKAGIRPVAGLSAGEGEWRALRAPRAGECPDILAARFARPLRNCAWAKADAACPKQEFAPSQVCLRGRENGARFARPVLGGLARGAIDATAIFIS